MRMGTTPIHTFKIPFDSSFVKKILVSYAQNDKELICKTEEDCVIDGDELKVKLTQEDTLKFNHRLGVQIQMKVLTVDDNVLASKIIVIDVEQILNSGVLS